MSSTYRKCYLYCVMLNQLGETHSLAMIAVILCTYTRTKHLHFLMQTHTQTGVYTLDLKTDSQQTKNIKYYTFES